MSDGIAGAAAALEQVVVAVPGVEELYRSRPTAGTIATTIQSAVATRAKPSGSRVLFDGTTVRVSIGTDGIVPAPVVARAVHDAVLDRAGELGLSITHVDVRIARVG